MKTVKIRNVVFGESMPKICVPMTSDNTVDLLDEVKEIKKTKADIVEWRLDYFRELDDLDKVVEASKAIREALGDIPLLATFRSKKEGGEREIGNDAYVKLNNTLSIGGNVDAIDMELFTGDNACRNVVKTAHENNVVVIMSSHDFDKTPLRLEIENRLYKMRELGADIPKIALMPRTYEDVLSVLKATNNAAGKLKDECPIITMSMGTLGAISRVAGEANGSCMTFGTVKKASAPGQIEADCLHVMLSALRLQIG